MLFSKAIQIKSLINRFNQERQASGFAVIKFDCGMFSIGHWSVSLSLSYKGCFFSSEMAQFAALLNRGGIIFFVGSNEVSPVLHFQ